MEAKTPSENPDVVPDVCPSVVLEVVRREGVDDRAGHRGPVQRDLGHEGLQPADGGLAVGVKEGQGWRSGLGCPQ